MVAIPACERKPRHNSRVDERYACIFQANASRVFVSGIDMIASVGSEFGFSYREPMPAL